jgi:sulfhydrogenase subunit beta (sulfur reductase)
MRMMKVITEPRLVEWLKSLEQEYQVYVPVELADGTRVMGTPDEGPVSLLGGQVAAKPTVFFFPQMDSLFHFEGGVLREGAPAAKPIFLVGLSAADADGLAFIDRFYNIVFKDEIYNKKRDHSLVAVISGKLGNGARFEPLAGKNCDLEFAYDGSKFYVAAYTPKGRALAERITDEDSALPFEHLQRVSVAQGLETGSILRHASQLILAGKVTDDFWREIGDECIACGSCIFYCPTCTCFDVYDCGDADRSERIRCWDACVLGGYTREASGHNPRNEPERSRRRISHKLEADVLRFGELGCVDCGRCDMFCPTGIGIRAVAKRIVDRFS